MKFAFKNSFVAVVIACAMTTQMSAMETPDGREFVTPGTSPRDGLSPEGSRVSPAGAAAEARAALSHSMAELPAAPEIRPATPPIEAPGISGQAQEIPDFSKMNSDDLNSFADANPWVALSDSARKAMNARAAELKRLERANVEPVEGASTGLPPALPQAPTAMGENIDELREYARARGGFSQLSEAEKAQYRALQEAFHHKSHKAVHEAADAARKAAEPLIPVVPQPKPTRLDSLLNSARANKVKTALGITAALYGMDFAHSYFKKTSKEELANNGLLSRLSLIHNKTYTATYAGKLKDFVQSTWTKKA